MISISISGGLSGLLFWILSANIFPPEEVGLASAIISSMGLISLLSLFGFDIVLIRILPAATQNNERETLISTCFTISLIVSIIFSIIFILGIQIWSPGLSILQTNHYFSALFVLFCLFQTIAMLQLQGVFIGLRKSEYGLYQSVFSFGRIITVLILTFLGTLGIVLSYCFDLITGVCLGLYFLVHKFELPISPKINKKVITEISHFSFGNYIARIFEFLPTYILPIIIVNLVSARDTAFFFIVWTAMSITLIFPKSVFTSLLIEGAHDRKSIKINLWKSLALVGIILFGIIIGVFFVGETILSFFGREYGTNGIELLKILVVAAIPYSVNYLFISLYRIKKEVQPIILTFFGISSITIFGSLILIPTSGIIGIGYAWMSGNVIVLILSGFYNCHKWNSLLSGIPHIENE